MSKSEIQRKDMITILHSVMLPCPLLRLDNITNQQQVAHYLMFSSLVTKQVSTWCFIVDSHLAPKLNGPFDPPARSLITHSSMSVKTMCGS